MVYNIKTRRIRERLSNDREVLTALESFDSLCNSYTDIQTMITRLMAEKNLPNGTFGGICTAVSDMREMAIRIVLALDPFVQNAELSKDVYELYEKLSDSLVNE